MYVIPDKGPIQAGKVVVFGKTDQEFPILQTAQVFSEHSDFLKAFPFEQNKRWGRNIIPTKQCLKMVSIPTRHGLSDHFFVLIPEYFSKAV